MDARANTGCRTKGEMEHLKATGLKARLREDEARRLRHELTGLELLKQLTNTCAEAGGLDAVEVIQQKLRQMFPDEHELSRLHVLRHFSECVSSLAAWVASAEAREEDDKGS